MRILINASGQKIGGGIQVSLSIIRHLQKLDGIDVIYVISKQVYLELTKEEQSMENILCGRKSILGNVFLLKKIENYFKPEVAISIFGPTLWKPKCKHICGFAIPHYIYESESPFFQRISFLNKLKHKIFKRTKIYLFKRNSDFLYSETFESSKRIQRITNKECRTIPNTLNQEFLKFQPEYHPPLDEINILVVAANYPHKNLSILKEVSKKLKEESIDFKIHLTIDEKSYKNGFSRDPVFINHGKLSLNSLAKLYQKGHLLLFPTLLECFSATYLEASYFKIPILTSDLPFAHTICEKNVKYFNPLDPSSIVNEITELLRKEDEFENYSRLSHKIYQESLDSNKRVKLLIEYAKEVK